MLYKENVFLCSLLQFTINFFFLIADLGKSPNLAPTPPISSSLFIYLFYRFFFFFFGPFLKSLLSLLQYYFCSLGFLKNIYLFLAVLGLRCCVWAFSSCGERGLLLVAVVGFSLQWLLLLWSTGSVVVARGL